MSSLRKFFVFIFNLLAVTSLKHEKGVFATSKVIFVKNLVLIPALVFIASYLIPSEILDSASAIVEFNKFAVTVFLKFVLSYYVWLFRALLFLVILIQLCHHEKIAYFVNACIKFVHFFELNPEFEVFERSCFRFLSLLSVGGFLFYYLLEFFLLFRQTWSAFLVFLLHRTHDFIALTFFCCTCLCLNFLLFLLNRFSKEFLTSFNQTWKKKTFVTQLKSIVRLFEAFQDAFGLQLSILLGVVSVNMTVQVFIIQNLKLRTASDQKF